MEIKNLIIPPVEDNLRRLYELICSSLIIDQSKLLKKDLISGEMKILDLGSCDYGLILLLFHKYPLNNFLGIDTDKEKYNRLKKKFDSLYKSYSELIKILPQNLFSKEIRSEKEFESIRKLMCSDVFLFLPNLKENYDLIIADHFLHGFDPKPPELGESTDLIQLIFNSLTINGYFVFRIHSEIGDEQKKADERSSSAFAKWGLDLEKMVDWINSLSSVKILVVGEVIYENLENKPLEVYAIVQKI